MRRETGMTARCVRIVRFRDHKRTWLACLINLYQLNEFEIESFEFFIAIIANANFTQGISTQ